MNIGEGNKIGEELKKNIKKKQNEAIKKSDEASNRRENEMEAYWCGVADAYARVLTRFGKVEDV